MAIGNDAAGGGDGGQRGLNVAGLTCGAAERAGDPGARGKHKVVRSLVRFVPSVERYLWPPRRPILFLSLPLLCPVLSVHDIEIGERERGRRIKGNAICYLRPRPPCRRPAWVGFDGLNTQIELRRDGRTQI